MTSMPASRSAAATTLAPRSCPSSPGLPTSTRILRCTSRPFPLSPSVRASSEDRALHVVAEHLAHRVPDLALGCVGPRAVEDLLHEVGLAGCRARGRRERMQRGRAGLVVARAPQLGERLGL